MTATFQVGDIVTIKPPFGDGIITGVVSELLGEDTVIVWRGEANSAYSLAYVAATGEVSTDFISPVVEATDWFVTQAAFRGRFRTDEKVRLELAAIDNPTAPEDLRKLAATIRANEKDVAACKYIDLKDPRTITGVTAYESLGFLATGRAAEILTTVPTADERYYP